MDIRVWFNPTPLLLGTGGFAACTAWLAFGPDTSGPIGRTLSSNGHALTMVAVAISLSVALIFGFHAMRMAFGMPALIATDHGLRVYVLPVKRLAWSEVDDVSIAAGQLLIVARGGRVCRINLALLGDCDTAVAQMREALAVHQALERPKA